MCIANIVYLSISCIGCVMKIKEIIPLKVGIRNFDELIEDSLDDFEITVENSDVIEVLEDGYIQGKSLGVSQIIVTSKINPLVKSSISIKVADATKELVEGTDFDVTYNNNVSAGTATATITLKR